MGLDHSTTRKAVIDARRAPLERASPEKAGTGECRFTLPEMLWSALRGSADPLWALALCGADGTLMACNDTFAGLSGCASGDILHWELRSAPSSRRLPPPCTTGQPIRLRLPGRPFDHSLDCELCRLRIDGLDGSWYALLRPPAAASGRVVAEGAQVIFTDAELPATILAQTDVAVIVTNVRGRIAYVNDRLCAITGYRPEEVLGANPSLLQSGRTERRVYQELWARLAAGESWEGQVLNRRKSGETYWSFQTITPIADDRGEVRWLASFSRDASEYQDNYMALHRLAYYDALCNIPNRRSLLVHLESLLQRGRGCRVGLIFLDIDNFKLINDGHGHHVGDRVLQVVVERIIALNRSRAFFARLGGDEFALLFHDVQDLAAMVEFADAFLCSLQEEIVFDGHHLVVSSSMGMALAPEHGDTPGALMKCADCAMYEAKRSGRNQWAVFDPSMHRAENARIAERSVLLKAMSGNELYPVYQPVVDCRSREIVYLEALVRWRHPEFGDLLPADFLPTFNRFGLIRRLNQWMLEAVCAELAAYSPGAVVCLNVGAGDLLQPDYVRRCLRVLRRNALAPSQLCLEITESELIENFTACRQTIRDLRSNGVRLYIDDFGVGYASLAYLKRLPVDGIKIDRCFLQDFPRDHQSMDIVAAIISLAHRLHLSVTAEGVECPEQAKMLCDLGCDYLQGYWFGYPGKLEEVAAPQR